MYMKVYDISRDFFKTKPYENDPDAKYELIKRMELGDDYNLSSVYASSHHSTHIDSPHHYIESGATIDKLPLDIFYGACTVVSVPQGIITGSDAEKIVRLSEKRLLIKGNGLAFLSQSAAFVFADSGIMLIGIDAPSIEASDCSEAHRELASNDIPIIEGLNLLHVTDGDYVLSAFPIKFDGLEAAFTRAVLLDPFYNRINY